MRFIPGKSHSIVDSSRYGFLSENAEFVEECMKRDFVFIGPPLEAIKAMGSKREAKTIMENAKVPILAGYHGAN